MKRLLPNRTLLFLTILMSATITSAHQPGANATRAQDEAAIRENVKQMEVGWNSKSGSLFAKPFAEDADYVVVNGMYLKGRIAIEEAHQRIFTSFYKNTTLSLSVKQIRFLRPDVAVVHVSGHLGAPATESQYVADASMTMVMTKDRHVWRIAAFQNTKVTRP